MRLEHPDGIPSPLPIDVYGWLWPFDRAYASNDAGDRASKVVWRMVEKESSRLTRPDSGTGVYRGHSSDGSWFVWVVDVNRDLLGRSPLLRGLAANLRVEPSQEVALALALRHVRTSMVTGGEEMLRHYENGMEVDRNGIGRIR